MFKCGLFAIFINPGMAIALLPVKSYYSFIMDTASTNWAQDFVIFLIMIVIVLIILAAMGRFDTFAVRMTKRLRVKKRGRIYTERIHQ